MNFLSLRIEKANVETSEVRMALERLGERLGDVSETLNFLEQMKAEGVRDNNAFWIAAELLLRGYLDENDKLGRDNSEHEFRFMNLFRNSPVGAQLRVIRVGRDYDDEYRETARRRR